MHSPEIVEQMRSEWNERAREDANYYVAFGRREQDDEEFFATAADVVRALERELKRLPSRRGRALEIGCGPGRLLRPMSRHFDEIHGVDIADEMIERAKRNLAGVPHAHAHHAEGSDLRRFADGYFDFVYSYAVFQHIPSGEVVFGYLREVARVLAPDGVAHLQLNGLPKTSQNYTTWSGFRVSAAEVRALTAEHGLQLLALDGVDTQYMWTTWRKDAAVRVRAIGNALTGENAVPARGRLASASLWIENLPRGCDLNTLEALVDGVAATGTYVGPEVDGLTQFNILPPPGTRTGLAPVDVHWGGRKLCETAWMRVIAPGPSVPRIESVTDGTNLLAERRIESGAVKVQLEEILNPEAFFATVGGLRVRNAEMFCTDPRNQRWDVSFPLPEGIAAGPHLLEIRFGERRMQPVTIEVV
ncbi:MAG: class I SAM-dependent methyltransferase [Acidobacteriota bacterium]|nr:class I SAM-dependent methyltransferase [Acidobacteriota bacterium]